MDLKESIWVEKYRPSKFSEIKGQEKIVERVEALVKLRNIPHLLFTGPPGVGKSTLALVVAKELFGEFWQQNFLEMNASDDRGIDTV
ncbi:MAG TPA: AAA family ATPase, partial [Candidatus Nanoarchaeia archaeon]|nr:AAA family ATPase [Candidatus Nanoarchaeia archaeon]